MFHINIVILGSRCHTREPLGPYDIRTYTRKSTLLPWGSVNSLDLRHWFPLPRHGWEKVVPTGSVFSRLKI